MEECFTGMRLPYIDYIEPILSARAPVFTKSGKGLECTVEVQNFGQVSSKKALVEVGYKRKENNKSSFRYGSGIEAL